MDKESDFKWNTLKPKDYFYFLINRISSKTREILDSIPYDVCIYPCLKENGDVNFVYFDVSDKSKSTFGLDEHPIDFISEIQKGARNEIIYMIHNDLKCGNLGDFVYFATYDSKKMLYEVRRIKLAYLKNNKKVIKCLAQYRSGEVDQSKNESFTDACGLMQRLDWKIRTEPLKPKKSNMFQYEEKVDERKD